MNKKIILLFSLISLQPIYTAESKERSEKLITENDQKRIERQLIRACVTGDVEEIKQIMQTHKLDINNLTYFSSPLRVAEDYNREKVATYLKSIGTR